MRRAGPGRRRGADGVLQDPAADRRAVVLSGGIERPWRHHGPKHGPVLGLRGVHGFAAAVPRRLAVCVWGDVLEPSVVDGAWAASASFALPMARRWRDRNEFYPAGTPSPRLTLRARRSGPSTSSRRSASPGATRACRRRRSWQTPSAKAPSSGACSQAWSVPRSRTGPRWSSTRRSTPSFLV